MIAEAMGDASDNAAEEIAEAVEARLRMPWPRSDKT